MQLGIGKVTLGLVVRGLHHRLGGFAVACLARPYTLRFCCGSRLTLGLRFRLGLRPQPPHCRLNLGPALRPAGGSPRGGTRPPRPRPRFPSPLPPSPPPPAT